MMALGQAPAWLLGIIMMILTGYVLYYMPRQKAEGRPLVWVLLGLTFTAGIVMLLSFVDWIDEHLGTIMIWVLVAFFASIILTGAVRYRGFSPQKRAEIRYFLQICGWAIGGFFVIVFLLKLFV